VILDGLYFDTRTQRGKGTAFERLVRQFLLTDPRYAERFDEVWMWSDWPERGARPDRGIDLVARERETGELCAVQCKFYDPDTGVITKGDVDSFLAESGTGEFTSRLFVSTTEHWNSAAEETVSRQAILVSRIGLEDLFNSTIDWDSFSLETPEVMVRTGGKSLREHQKRALDAVTAGLSTADRGKLIMACGTGKTFTSLRIAEGLVDLRRRDEGGEDRGVGAGVDRLHEGDVGEHRLLVGGAGVRDEGDRADRALDRVQERQAGEDAGGHVLLGLVEGGPGLHVVGQRHLLGQPEVAGEAVPDLEVLVVGQAVPVDGLDAVDQLDGLVHQFLPRFG